MGAAESQPAAPETQPAAPDAEIAVFFVGAAWCGACKATKPHWDKFVAQNPGVRTVYIDIDAVDGAEQEHYAAMAEAFPTFLYVRGGGRVEKIVGMRSADDLRDLLPDTV
jgi:thiol-disulfide isomerase/thioredoxin